MQKGPEKGFSPQKHKGKEQTPMENKGQSGGLEPIPPVGSEVAIFKGVNSANSTPRDNFSPGSPEFPRGHDRETTPLPLGAMEGASSPLGAPASPPSDRGETHHMVNRGRFPTEAPQEILNDPDNDSNLAPVPISPQNIGFRQRISNLALGMQINVQIPERQDLLEFCMENFRCANLGGTPPVGHSEPPETGGRGVPRTEDPRTLDPPCARKHPRSRNSSASSSLEQKCPRYQEEIGEIEFFGTPSENKMEEDDPEMPEMNPPGYSSGEEGEYPVQTPENPQPPTPMEKGGGGEPFAQSGVLCCAVPFPNQNENPENDPREEHNGGDYDAWFCAMDAQIDFLTQGFNELVAQTMPGMQQQLNATFEIFEHQIQVLDHHKRAFWVKFGKKCNFGNKTSHVTTS